MQESISLEPSNIDVNLHIPALIPDTYIPDVHTRLTLYKRLSNIADQQGFDELQVEMIDRFGLLPQEVKHLIRVTQIKLQAESIGVAKINASAQQGKLEFSATPTVDPLKIVKMVQNQPQYYQLRGANQLLFKLPMHSAEDRLIAIEELLRTLIHKN